MCIRDSGTLVRATAQGARAFRSLGAQHARTIVDRMSTLDDAELQALLALTTKLREPACPTELGETA